MLCVRHGPHIPDIQAFLGITALCRKATHRVNSANICRVCSTSTSIVRAAPECAPCRAHKRKARNGCGIGHPPRVIPICYSFDCYRAVKNWRASLEQGMQLHDVCAPLADMPCFQIAHAQSERGFRANVLSLLRSRVPSTPEESYLGTPLHRCRRVSSRASQT